MKKIHFLKKKIKQNYIPVGPRQYSVELYFLKMVVNNI